MLPDDGNRVRFFFFRKELVMNNMQLFENQPVRMAWDEEREEWYFSIVDVVKVLTEQPSTRGAADSNESAAIFVIM